jgi:hypothetical protein
LLGVRFIRNSLRRLECLALGYAEGEVRDAKKHDYHGDYGRVGNRAGHCASAVCILGNAWKAGWCRSGRYYQQAGPVSYGTSAPIMPLAALGGPLPGAALCALSALRGTSSGATMYPPVGRAHRYVHMCRKGTRARRTGFSHKVGAPTTVGGSGPSLCAPVVCRTASPR